MESLVIDVKNFLDEITKHKKVKIRRVQGYSYGMIYHVLKGRFLNAVSVPGGVNINLELNGGSMIYLRTVFDTMGAFDPKEMSPGQDVEILATPVLHFRNENITWNYEFVPGDYREVFDRSQQPLQISFKDFDMRGWDMGLQTVPVSVKPYRARSGVLGMNYVATSPDRSGSPTPSPRSLTDKMRKGS